MSKEPNNKVLEPKYYSVNGIWALIPHYLGPWTLGVTINSMITTIIRNMLLTLTVKGLRDSAQWLAKGVGFRALGCLAWGCFGRAVKHVRLRIEGLGLRI